MYASLEIAGASHLNQLLSNLPHIVLLAFSYLCRLRRNLNPFQVIDNFRPMDGYSLIGLTSKKKLPS